MLLSSNESKFVKIGGHDYLYFGGTNYLGLAHREELLAVLQSCFNDFGFSSGASRLTSGENDVLIALEHELADFCNSESAVSLPAGYMANQAALEALDADIDVWIISTRAHSSICSAVKHSKARVIRTDVADFYECQESLRTKFKVDKSQRVGMFAEPIDALTGKVQPIQKLLEQLEDCDYLVLDECQSIGVLGASGKGALEEFSLAPQANVLRTGTFSKAFGTYGGFVLAASSIIYQLKAKSDGYRGSTSLPPPLCAASREAVRLLKENPLDTVSKLKDNIAYLNALFGESAVLSEALNWPSQYAFQSTPIYYLLGFSDVSERRKKLLDHSIYVPSMANYFNDGKESGFRFTIQSGHEKDDLARLVKGLEDL